LQRAASTAAAEPAKAAMLFFTASARK
jgi:hypothetical protein